MLNILLLCILAGFVCYKLFSVLGREDGESAARAKRQKAFKDVTGTVDINQKSTSDKKVSFLSLKLGAKPTKKVGFADSAEIQQKSTVSVPDIELATSELNAALKNIKTVYVGFSIEKFLESAKFLFEHLINTSFTNKYSELKPFLSEGFFGKIQSLNVRLLDQNLQRTNSLVKIDQFNVADIKINNQDLSIAIEAKYTYVSYTLNELGEVVQGNKNEFLKSTQKLVFIKQNFKDEKTSKWILEDISST